jgi:hypothetical protein
LEFTVGDAPIGPGSRFVIVDRDREYGTTIATYERPSALVFEATGQMDLTITYAFGPADGGTSYGVHTTSARRASCASCCRS